MSAPEYSFVMPGAPPVRPKRRRWLVAIVVAWILALVGLVLWSVRNDPPTVPEQRDIARALPVLQRATGAMLAAAQGPGRAVVLGELRLARGCRITPVRDGIEATREVTVYVRADQARPALDAIAAGLPGDYRPEVAQSARGSWVALHADAGGYVSIDTDTVADAQVFTLETSTGCRPVADTGPGSADPPAAVEPVVLRDVLKTLGADQTPTVRTIACPGGAVASTYTVDSVPSPADLGVALRPALNGATVVRSDPRGWAYRLRDDSVVVTQDGGRMQVSATTACRQ